MDITDGEIKLYSNQVYIADNIKEVVPEFLFIVKGNYGLSRFAFECFQKCITK